MGYCIPILGDKIEEIPAIIKSIGLSVIGTENRPDGVYYLCQHPKNIHRTWIFGVTHESETSPRIFKCRLSQMSKQLVASLHQCGFFEKDTRFK